MTLIVLRPMNPQLEQRMLHAKNVYRVTAEDTIIISNIYRQFDLLS